MCGRSFGFGCGNCGGTVRSGCGCNSCNSCNYPLSNGYVGGCGYSDCGCSASAWNNTARSGAFFVVPVNTCCGCANCGCNSCGNTRNGCC